MTNEEMQKAIEFIINQQALFSTDIQKLQEAQTESNQLLTRLAAITVKGFEDTNAKINVLIDAQIRTEEHLRRTDEELNKTSEAVRNLTAVVDRYFRERNGRKDSE
jgi:ABC-type transporter Mla subunit MlaD